MVVGGSMEGEGEIFVWDLGQDSNKENASSVLVGKIWSSKSINVRAAIDSMIKLWNPKGKIVGNILDAKEKIFAFRFSDVRDKARVTEGQPWHFDKYVWCFDASCEEGRMTDTPLFILPIWARIYDLPAKGRSNVKNIENLGKQLGVFVSVDEAPFPEMERAIRVRVLHDVRRPLKNCVEIRMPNLKVVSFKVKYEKLPTYCYGCGILGHGEKDCEEGPYEEGELRYDESLRASPWKVLKTAVNTGSNVARSLDAVFDREEK
ncbi:uncharacterized protein LOC141654943 [Silene latifolia]|uniref:uncharacterized protein LOC141654943 n=1 Tax=Silene latifolia TaxID=37657 RepID=UPI003D77C33B